MSTNNNGEINSSDYIDEDDIRPFDEIVRSRLIEESEDDFTSNKNFFDDYDAEVQQLLLKQVNDENEAELLYYLKEDEFKLRKEKYQNIINKIKSLMKIDAKNIDTYQNMLDIFDYLLFNKNMDDIKNIDVEETITNSRKLLNQKVYPVLFDNTILTDYTNTNNFTNTINFSNT